MVNNQIGGVPHGSAKISDVFMPQACRFLLCGQSRLLEDLVRVKLILNNEHGCLDVRICHMDRATFPGFVASGLNAIRRQVCLPYRIGDRVRTKRAGLTSGPAHPITGNRVWVFVILCEPWLKPASIGCALDCRRYALICKEVLQKVAIEEYTISASTVP